METMRSALPDFFKANVALLTLLLGSLPLGSKDLLLDHLQFSSLAILAIEGAVILVLGYIHQDQSDRSHFDEFAAADLTIKSKHGRFGTRDDFSGTERVYREWFSPHLSVDDGEYCKLMDRGKLVRVVEARIVDGSQKATIIAGFYSVWPLSLNTFQKMADGRLPERELTSAMILDPSDPNAEVLYVPEICTSKRAWDEVKSPLVQDLARYIGSLLTANPHIGYVAAWPYTRQGRRHVKRAKMTRVGRSWMRRYFWASRDVIQTIPATRGRFKAEWTTS